MSKRRRNRPNGPKPAQPEASTTISKKPSVSAESTSVAAAVTFTSPSRLAYSGENVLPVTLREPASAIPCDATQKSVVLEPMVPPGSLPTVLDTQTEHACAQEDVAKEPTEARGAEEHTEVEAASARADMDSFPPLVSSQEDEEAKEEYPPSVIARRKRARKVVGALIGAAALFFAFGVGKTALASRGTTGSATAAQSTVQVPRVQAMIGAPMASLARSVAVNVKQEPAARPAEAAAAAPGPAASTLDPEQGAKLRKEAESLLNRGRFQSSIEVSRAAIAADPSQAMPYLLLGTALQSTGKWKEGIQAYSECVRTATHGPVHECSAVGGRK